MSKKLTNNYAFVSTMRKIFTPGIRIKLQSMRDPYAVPDGTLGTVDFVDDAGQIQMKWDNGSSLALIYGEDLFEIIPDNCGTKFVIKGVLKDKTVYYKNTSNELLWGSEWDVPNFAETIENATLYDSSDEAEEVCSNIGFGNFQIYPVCPSCHKEYSGHPAISRHDNKTEICEYCGLIEALWKFFENEKKATNS